MIAHAKKPAVRLFDLSGRQHLEAKSRTYYTSKVCPVFRDKYTYEFLADDFNLGSGNRSTPRLEGNWICLQFWKDRWNLGSHLASLAKEDGRL